MVEAAFVEWPVRETVLGLHIEDIPRIEPRLSHKHGAVRVFYPEPKTLLSDSVKARIREGRLPCISVKPGMKWHEVAAGNQVNYWRTQRQDAQNNPEMKYILVPSPEPDSKDESERYGRYDQTDSRNADDFNGMMNYLVDFFADTPNVRLCACTTGGNIVAGWARRYMENDCYYIAADPYNWCPTSGHGEGNRSFADIVAPLRSCGGKYDKPIIIPEMACWYRDNDPGYRAQWISQIPAVVADWPKLKAMFWFSKDVECDFRLDTQDASLDAWDHVLEHGAMRSL